MKAPLIIRDTKMTDRVLSIASKLLHGRKNYISLKYPSVSVDVIEQLLVEALFRQIEYPYISKNNIIGCLCKGGICTNYTIFKYPKLMVECEPCIDDCSICFEPMTDDCVKTVCSHIFHRSCINKIHPINSWSEFVPCPLCRNSVRIGTIKNAKNKFSWYKLCVCCVRHSLRRPSSLTDFSSSTFKEDYRPYKCNDDYANILRKLLDDYDEIRPICKCDCRSKMRHYSRIIPETLSLSQDASNIQLDAPDIPPSDILPSPRAVDISGVDISGIEPYIQLPPLNILPSPHVKGNAGRFRSNLLGTRVEFSSGSVITPDIQPPPTPDIQLPPIPDIQPPPIPDIQPPPTPDIQPPPDEELHNLAFNELFTNISL